MLGGYFNPIYHFVNRTLDILGKLKKEALRFKSDIEVGKPKYRCGKYKVQKNPGPGPEVRIVDF